MGATRQRRAVHPGRAPAQVNGLYVHASPPRVVAVNPGALRQWLRGGDLEKLQQLVLDGQGSRLLGEYSPDPKVRSFLRWLPSGLNKVDAAHSAAAAGQLSRLEAALGLGPGAGPGTTASTRVPVALCKDRAGAGLLHKAVFKGHTAVIDWLLDHFPETVQIKDREGRTALHYCGVAEDPDALWKRMVDAGADVNTTDSRGRLPGYYLDRPEELRLPTTPQNPAGSRGSAVDGLVVKPASIRIWIHDRDLAKLQQMVWEGHGGRLRNETSKYPSVKRFLDAVPFVMGAIKDVHIAAVNGDLATFRRRTADPVPAMILTSKDANGLTPLHKAAGLGHAQVAEEIVARMPSAVSMTDSEGRTALHYAAAVRDQELYNRLVRAGADELAQDHLGRTPEHYKAKPGDIDTAVLRVIPEAPRTSATFPPGWDWGVLIVTGSGIRQRSKTDAVSGESDRTSLSNGDLASVDSRDHEDIVTKIVGQQGLDNHRTGATEDKGGSGNAENGDVPTAGTNGDEDDAVTDDRNGGDVDAATAEPSGGDVDPATVEIKNDVDDNDEVVSGCGNAEVEPSTDSAPNGSNSGVTDTEEADGNPSDTAADDDDDDDDDDTTGAGNEVDGETGENENGGHTVEPDERAELKVDEEREDGEKQEDNEDGGAAGTRDEDLADQEQGRGEVDQASNETAPAESESDVDDQGEDSEAADESEEGQNAVQEDEESNAADDVVQETKSEDGDLDEDTDIAPRETQAGEKQEEPERGSENEAPGDVPSDDAEAETSAQNKPPDGSTGDGSAGEVQEEPADGANDVDSASLGKEDLAEDSVGVIDGPKRLSRLWRIVRTIGVQKAVWEAHKQQDEDERAVAEVVSKDLSSARGRVLWRIVNVLVVHGLKWANTPAVASEAFSQDTYLNAIFPHHDFRSERARHWWQIVRVIALQRSFQTARNRSEQEAGSRAILVNSEHDSERARRNWMKVQIAGRQKVVWGKLGKKEPRRSARTLWRKVRVAVMLTKGWTRVARKATSSAIDPRGENRPSPSAEDLECTDSTGQDARGARKESTSDLWRKVRFIGLRKAVSSRTGKSSEPETRSPDPQVAGSSDTHITGNDDLVDPGRSAMQSAPHPGRQSEIPGTGRSAATTVTVGDGDVFDVDAGKESESESKTDPQPQPDPDPESAKNPDLDPEPEPEPQLEPDTDPERDPNPDFEPDPVPETEPESDLKEEEDVRRTFRPRPPTPRPARTVVEDDDEDEGVGEDTEDAEVGGHGGRRRRDLGGLGSMASTERMDPSDLLDARPPAEDPEVEELIARGDLAQLAELVLAGDGDRLVGRMAENSEMQSFLDNVPAYMNKIRTVHSAARSGNLRELQAALDRRKFALARDKRTAAGSTPLHCAVLLGQTAVVRYLAGRFPETLAARDYRGRTALHYAATVADNGHYYNLLLNLGADRALKDSNGRTAASYMQNPGVLTHRQLLSEIGAPESIAEDTFSDKVPSDSVSSRRDLNDPHATAMMDKCYQLLRDAATEHQDNPPATAMLRAVVGSFKGSYSGQRDLLDAPEVSNREPPVVLRHIPKLVFDKNKCVLTRMDHSLLDVLWPAILNQMEEEDTQPPNEKDSYMEEAGILAPDYESYFVFGDIILPVIKTLNGFDPKMSLRMHPASQFFEEAVEEVSSESTMLSSISKLELRIDENTQRNMDLDPEGRLIVRGTVQCARNLEDYNLPLNLSAEQLVEVEHLIKTVLLVGRLPAETEVVEADAPVPGEYFMLSELPEGTRYRLQKAGLWPYIPSDPDRTLRTHGKHFPVGRGVFVSNEASLVVWINIQDHVRVMAATPDNQGGKLGLIFRNMAEVTYSLGEVFRFKRDMELGFLTARPWDVGNTVRFSVTLRLPMLGREPENLVSLCKTRGLRLRHTMHPDMFILANQQVVGVAEYQTYRDFITAMANILQLEQRLDNHSFAFSAIIRKIFKPTRSSR